MLLHCHHSIRASFNQLFGVLWAQHLQQEQALVSFGKGENTYKPKLDIKIQPIFKRVCLCQISTLFPWAWYRASQASQWSLVDSQLVALTPNRA